LLFGKRGEVAVFQVNSAFGGAGGRESPARTALSLIFNTSDGTFGGPVKRARWVSTNAEISKSLHFLADPTSEFGFVAIVNVLEFSRCKIGKFVQFDFPGVVGSIVGFNEVIVGLEDIVFVEEFLWGIRFVEHDHPLSEGVLVDGLFGGKSRG